MKACIIRQFGDQLAFHRPHKINVTEFVFNSSISQSKLGEKSALATEAAQRAAEEGLAAFDCLGEVSHLHAYCTAPAQDLYNAALFLQSQIRGLKNSMPLPPAPSDLTKYATKDQLPTSLYNFLVWLIVGDQERQDSLTLDERINVPSDADHISLGQYLIHAVRYGRIKTPKHVALPMAVKQLIGSGNVVTLLN